MLWNFFWSLLIQSANPLFFTFLTQKLHIYLSQRIVTSDLQWAADGKECFQNPDLVSKGLLRNNREGLKFGNIGGSGAGRRTKQAPL